MSRICGPVAGKTSLAALDSVDQLSAAVENAIPEPLNHMQISAFLETSGVTDNVALQQYNKADVFCLAESVFNILLDKKKTLSAHGLPSEKKPQNQKPTRIDRLEAFVTYLRGPASLIPLLLIAAMLGVNQIYGQWSNRRLVSCLVAMIGSLLVTSGFIQTATRKGSIYIGMGQIDAARRFIVGVFGKALVATAIAAVLLSAAGIAMDLIQRQDVPFPAGVFLSLSILWLLSAILNIIGQSLWFGLSLLLGAAGGYGGVILFKPDGPLQDTLAVGATGISFIIAACIMLAVIVRYFGTKADAGTHNDTSKTRQGRTHMRLDLAPYFLYGVVTSLTVIAGHIGGWFGHLNGSYSRITALSLSEICLTIGLISYILTSGISERTVQKFWKNILTFQKETPAANPRLFSDKIVSFYRGNRFVFLVAQTAVAAGIFFVTKTLQSRAGHSLLGLQWSREQLIIISFGLAGYSLYAAAIFDAMFLISLSKPLKVLRSVTAAFIVTAGVSILAGAGISFEFGATGVAAGGLVFLVGVHRSLKRLFRNADFHIYDSL